MSNRIALVSLFLILFSPLLGVAQDKISHENYTNVVLVLIDDLSHYGVGIYGGTHIGSARGEFENLPFETPRMDQLAKEGMMCENAFTYPLCENTRIALMSGQNNNRNYLNCKEQHHSDITFGDTFQKAGYATGIFGKWKQTRGTPSIHAKDYIYEFGWDEFACFDVVGERQRFINPNMVINGEIHDYEGRTDVDPHTGRRWYGPDICNRMALEFIEKNKNKPFFLYCPMMLVHDEHKPTPDTKPNKLFDEFPEQIRNHNGKIGDDRRYLPDMIEYTDALIGRIVDKVETLGLTEKTLIIVMGDNGTKECFTHILDDGSVYPARKGGNTDNGIHVPLIVRQPGTVVTESGDEPHRYNGLVHLTDIYATIADAAGLEISNPDAIDGVSFWNQAVGADGEARSYIHGWFNGNNRYITTADNLTEYVFDKEFKRYAPCKNYPDGRFFDLRTDPLEREGGSYAELRWGVRKYAGLDLDQLTTKQQAAYNRLGKILEKHQIVHVEKLEIQSKDLKLKKGSEASVSCEVLPLNATRRNVVWESSDPSVASIDKFGDIKALKKGKATINVYSWDDAYPKANGKAPEYLRDGIQDSILVEVL